MYDQPFAGRMSRQNFIYGQLLLFAIVGIIGLYVFRDGITLMNIQALLPILIIAIIPQVILVIRRLHDINISGLWSFLILVPYISLLFAIFISVKPGSDEDNMFGPVDTRNVFDSLLNKN